MVGGIILFIKLDRKEFPDPKLKPHFLKKLDGFAYIVAPATIFEEFNIPNKLIESNVRLSSYLDKIRKGS